MANKGKNITSSPMSWEQFQTLMSRMAFEIDNHIVNDTKKQQESKFLLLIAVGSYTGLRIGDILALTWEDLLNKDSIELVEQKRKKRRLITINNNLKNLLSKYFDYIKPAVSTEYIFTNKQGSPLSIQYVNQHLKKLLIKYKIKVKNPSSHTLRKTFGMRVFETNFKSDEALIVLSHVFNHSNTAITRRYIGIEGEKIENVYLSI